MNPVAARKVSSGSDFCEAVDVAGAVASAAGEDVFGATLAAAAEDVDGATLVADELLPVATTSGSTSTKMCSLVQVLFIAATVPCHATVARTERGCGRMRNY